MSKSEIVERLLQSKQSSGKTFTQIGEETGLTNVYVGQLFHRQAQLADEFVPLLKKSVPALTSDLINKMKEPPLRSYDPQILQDPTIYRLNEATLHNAESIKRIINEEFGDGIMSAIGFYCNVSKIKGKDGEDRVMITMNGKFLPYTVQKQEENKDFTT